MVLTVLSHSNNRSFGMNSSVLARPSIAIDNMEAIKISTLQSNKPQQDHSFRTLGETAMLSETSSTISSCEEEQELEDTVVVKSKTPITHSQPARRRSSILKHSNEEIPISLKQKAFKHLPPPDMDKIKRNVSVVSVKATSSERPRLSRQNSVGFASVIIREYDQTIGDNPSVSYGPPISLDWEYTELESITLEQYEAHRPPRRSMRAMCMNFYQRRNKLTFVFGYKEEEVKAASKQADKCKRERAVTKYFLPYSKVEDVISSAGRKAKRVVKKGGNV